MDEVSGRGLAAWFGRLVWAALVVVPAWKEGEANGSSRCYPVDRPESTPALPATWRAEAFPSQDG